MWLCWTGRFGVLGLVFSGPLCSLCALFDSEIERYCVAGFVLGPWP